MKEKVAQLFKSNLNLVHFLSLAVTTISYVQQNLKLLFEGGINSKTIPALPQIQDISEGMGGEKILHERENILSLNFKHE